MKKRELFKKQIASLLALCMVSNFFIAADAGILNVGGSETIVAQATENTDAAATGRIEVSVSMALFLDSAEFTAELLNSNREVVCEPVTVQFNKEKTDAETITFSQLPDGEYTLQVTGNGFKTYKQTIEVKGGNRYALQLTAGFCSGYKYYTDDEGLHPGVLLIGDIDGEGTIDVNDKDYLVDLIHEGVQVNEENKSADLNGDGDINLEDLMYFAKGYLEETDKNTQAHVEKTISPDAVKMETPENVTVEINDEGEATFKVDGEVGPKNPIVVGFEVASEEPVDGISFGVSPETPIQQAVIEVETVDENGNSGITKLPLEKNVYFTTEGGEEEENEAPSPLAEFHPYAEIDSKGNIQVHLGTQVAVKKVSLRVTALAMETGESTNLVTIAKTEFVNGMESRMPEPEVTAPQDVTAKPGSDQFTVSWSPVLNVTGYEVVVKEKQSGKVVKTVSTSTTSAMVGDNNHNSKAKLIKNLTTYQVTVQAVNGAWRSQLSKTVEVTPMPAGKPDMVNNVKIEGGYKKLSVSWSKMPDTTGYRVYYKLKDSEKPEEMKSTTATNCLIEDLEDKQEYEVYVVGYNAIGDAPKSLVVIERTGSMKPSEMAKYGAINLDENGMPSSNHIESITRNNSSATIEGFEGNEVVLADRENNTAWATVDNDPETFYQLLAWDDGGSSSGINNEKGLTYEFDQVYNIGSIGFWSTVKPTYASVRWWDENGTEHQTKKITVSSKQGLNQIDYYSIDLPNGIKAQKVQFGFARTEDLVTLNEVVFYEYNDLLKRSKNLFADELRTVLKEEVTMEFLDKLYAEANTPDQFGNLHPDKVLVNLELDWAYKIIKAKELGDPILIHNKITTNGPQESNQNRGFGGLNGWQPMGVNVANDEEIVIYVGSNAADKGGREYGGDPELTAVITQYHTESGNLVLGTKNLVVGENVIRINKDSKLSQETGGMLYISYNGGSTNTEKYSIRISGGTKVPILDLYEVKDHETRVSKAAAYIKELDTYVKNIEEQHEELHAGSKNKYIDKKYDPQNCILGGTEILLDSMLYSIPAQQVIKGLGSGSVESRAEKLVASMDATEEMMCLFYQHKGLNTSADYLSNYDRQVKGQNYTPLRHQNIRYMRQFENSFMYAAGNHIGIEWGSTAGMVCGKPNYDAEGNYKNNGYFGWGIAHEVGHCLDQGAISMPEITNNYFAELAKGGETNANRRFKYSEVYKKVSSGQKGASSNVATQLALYWQLHIAYDNDPNHTIYTNYNDQLERLFYARFCKIAREGKVTLAAGTTLGDGTILENAKTLTVASGDKDQNLMRLACAATQKNVLEFFERWGKEPNQATIDFAKNFEKETRAIWYTNEDSRNYVKAQDATVKSKLGANQDVEAIASVEIAVDENTPNEVNLTITPNNTVPKDAILGYEIFRCTIEGGKVKKSVVGFTQDGTYKDTISSMNNRTVSYEVIMVDQYLNRSAAKTSKMIKIQHEGAVDKSKFQISTTWLMSNEKLVDHDEMEIQDEEGHTHAGSCDQGADEYSASLAIDSKSDTVYNATVDGVLTYPKDKEGYTTQALKGNRYGYFDITLDFSEELTIQGFKYKGLINKTAPNSDIFYELFVQDKNGDFTKNPVSSGTIDKDGDDIIYFAYQDGNVKKYVYAYSTRKLFIRFYTNARYDNISIAELDVLKATGDNVEFRTTTDKSTTLIGVMGEDYVYDKAKGYKIPEGSLVFTGKYKGNPAYNVVLLFDDNGKQVLGKDGNYFVSDQTILADVPDGGSITDVSEGTWIYWIEPEYQKGMELPKKVRAELYRVDNPLTNAGQRLVSDSLFEELTATTIDELPTITFGK